MFFMMQSKTFTRLEHSRLIPKLQPLVVNLLPLTTQEINIPTHPTLRMNQNHRITLLLESVASVELTDELSVIALTAMGFMNLYTKLTSLDILSKKIQNILDLIFRRELL